MDNNSIPPHSTPRQFSDLATGETGWVIIIGQATEIEKIGFQAGRKLAKRRGKVWISPNRLIYPAKEAAEAGLEKLLERGRKIRRQRQLAGGAA